MPLPDHYFPCPPILSLMKRQDGQYAVLEISRPAPNDENVLWVCYTPSGSLLEIQAMSTASVQ